MKVIKRIFSFVVGVLFISVICFFIFLFISMILPQGSYGYQVPDAVNQEYQEEVARFLKRPDHIEYSCEWGRCEDPPI